jgi:hypothetical protein
MQLKTGNRWLDQVVLPTVSGGDRSPLPALEKANILMETTCICWDNFSGTLVSVRDCLWEVM